MNMPSGASALLHLAALPSQPDFRETLIRTVIVGVIAFVICGGFLAGFIRSLSRESDRGDLRFTLPSALWLTGLILTLLAFSVGFMWYALV
ncbi:MAG: hypothetical protein KY432_09790 [Acidobacteria bacterium]|nr:hypothetical protein [Acidobacteriota bacterium]